MGVPVLGAAYLPPRRCAGSGTFSWLAWAGACVPAWTPTALVRGIMVPVLAAVACAVLFSRFPEQFFSVRADGFKTTSPSGGFAVLSSVACIVTLFPQLLDTSFLSSDAPAQTFLALGL